MACHHPSQSHASERKVDLVVLTIERAFLFPPFPCDQNRLQESDVASNALQQLDYKIFALTKSFVMRHLVSS